MILSSRKSLKCVVFVVIKFHRLRLLSSAFSTCTRANILQIFLKIFSCINHHYLNCYSEFRIMFQTTTAKKNNSEMFQKYISELISFIKLHSVWKLNVTQTLASLYSTNTQKCVYFVQIFDINVVNKIILFPIDSAEISLSLMSKNKTHILL